MGSPFTLKDVFWIVLRWRTVRTAIRFGARLVTEEAKQEKAE